MSASTHDIVFSCSSKTHSKALELAGLAQFRGLRPFVWSEETRSDPEWLVHFTKAAANATLVSLHEQLPTVDSIIDTSNSQFIELAKSKPLRTLVATTNGGQPPDPVAKFFGAGATFCSFHEIWLKVIAMQTPLSSSVRGFGYAIISQGDASLLNRIDGTEKRVVKAGERLWSFAKNSGITYPFDASGALMRIARGQDFETFFPPACLARCQSDFVLIYDLPGLKDMELRRRVWLLESYLTQEAGFKGRLLDVLLLRVEAYCELLQKDSMSTMIIERFGSSPHRAFMPHRLPSCGSWDELSSRLSQYLANPPGAAVGHAVGLP